MAPIKSSLAKSAKQLLGFFNTADLGLRGATQNTRFKLPDPIDASGGTKIDSSPTVHYHVFVSDSPFVVTTGGDADIFLIGGGGGSSTSLAGGGGAGGAVHLTGTTLTGGVTYSVVVGAGGAERDIAAPSSLTGYSGANSTFTHPGDSTVLTALGGGYGASYATNNAANGGCGGGKETGSPDTGGLGQQPSQAQPFHTSHGGTLNQYGNDGNQAVAPTGNFGGGGGGTGGGGSDSKTGGNAQPFSDFPAPVLAPAIPSGPVRTRWTSEVGPTGLFGGGGGGGARDGHSAGKGGTGGGGDGYNTSPSPQESSDGADYTGGGGGSGSYPFSPGENGAGGKGIVIIRYVDATI